MTELKKLSETLMIVTEALGDVNARLQKLENPDKRNKNGLPIGMEIFGKTQDSRNVSMIVNPDNYQIVLLGEQRILKGKEFNSLSEAAEFFSGIKRKSGWVFWKDVNGIKLKETFKG